MEIVLRATAVYWFLWLVVRGTGKRSLAELTPLDLVVVVVLGDLVQQGITQEDMSVTGAVVAVSVFVLWTVMSDWLTRRSVSSARWLSGAPAVLLRSGEPLRKQLESERVTVDELKEQARSHGYGDLSELEWVILETDGRFSFIARKERES